MDSVPMLDATSGIAQSTSVIGKSTEETQDPPTDNSKISKTTKMFAHFDMNEKGMYRELHDQLDVSVFG